jgi:hypothetical protein
VIAAYDLKDGVTRIAMFEHHVDQRRYLVTADGPLRAFTLQ